MPNAIFFVFAKRKEMNQLGKKTMHTLIPPWKQCQKSDESQYCNMNTATPKATNFNYQLGVRTNLRGIDIICATYNV